MDKKYRVVVNYDTGDSFGRDPGQEMEVWDNDDEAIARENCNRILMQHRFNEAMEHRRRSSFRATEAEPEHPAYVKEENVWGMKRYYVYLLDDNREEHRVSCLEWQGYFDSFNFVEVKILPYQLS